MTTKAILEIICLFGVILGGMIWAGSSMARQSKNDWETLRELEQKAAKVETKEEVELLHREFVEKANKIYNRYIHVRLSKLDGYLRGLYKSFNTNIKID